MSFDNTPEREPDNVEEVFPSALFPEETTIEETSIENTQGAFVSEEPVDETDDISSKSYTGRFASEEEPEEPEQEETLPEQNSDTEDSELNQIVSEYSSVPEVQPEETEEIEEPEALPRKKKGRAIKKGRPRRRKGEGLLGIPNILVTIVWCALVLMISFTLGRMIWVCAAEVLAFGREDRTVTITIDNDDFYADGSININSVAKKLQREEIIHYPGLFKLYASFAVDDGDIQPGMWDLNTKYDYHALVRMMSPSSTKEVVKVMIPEGYSCRQVFALLEENKVCTAKDIASYAATGELDSYWFLENVSRGDQYCLEGFLFPDTYEFYKNDSPRNILTKMLNNFNNRFDEQMRWEIDTLNGYLTELMRKENKGQDYIDSHLFSVRDVVIVASMIEKEAANAQEGKTVASVIYNRLFNWGQNPAFLNIDATIIYAMNGSTDIDVQYESPYNTYKYTGLTPGAIANPGLASLKAALEPEKNTGYYYYVLNPSTHVHDFSATKEEHDRKVEQYRNMQEN